MSFRGGRWSTGVIGVETPLPPSDFPPPQLEGGDGRGVAPLRDSCAGAEGWGGFGGLSNIYGERERERERKSKSEIAALN